MELEHFKNLVANTKSMYDDVGESIVSTKSAMQCALCGKVEPLTAKDAAHYTFTGWPKCCGQTMRLI